MKGWIGAFRADWRSTGRSFVLNLDRRISNRLQDRRAVLAGACNASTWSEALQSFRGGYAHWRCAKAAGHFGWHRYNNYRWGPGPFGRVVYDPLHPADNGMLTAFAKLAEGRHSIPTARQDRLMRRLGEANLILARQRREKELGRVVEIVANLPEAK